MTPLKCTNKENYVYFDNIIRNLRAGGGGHIREDAVLISGESEIKGLVWVPQKRNPIPKK